MSSWSSWLAAEALAREGAALQRRIATVEGATDPWAVYEGERLLNLSSNSYLGIARHPALVAAAKLGSERSAGAGASRLVVGSDTAYAWLEQRIAEFKGTEQALVLGNGYLANVGTLACLLDRRCGVVSDALNHASIIDGIRLSRATVYRYAHADVADAESKLRTASEAGHERVLLVTDSVFSMDGDVAPLEQLVELKQAFGAALMIDDAHGTGVYGRRGAGFADELGLTDMVDVQVGTFSKAFGAYGAYVAADEVWIRQLTNTSRTLTYSTGLPPSLIETVSAALTIVSDADAARSSLAGKAQRFRTSFGKAGLDTAGSSTQIIPIVVGESAATLGLAERLRARGLLVQPIRPPTVPQGTARIRFSLMATHSDAELDEAASTVVEEAAEAGLIVA